LAIRTETGSKSLRNVAQHRSRAWADPALQPGLVPRPDLAQLDPGVQLRGQAPDQRAEIDPVRSAEVDGEDAGLVQVVDGDDFHRQRLLADQPPGRDLGLTAPGPVSLVPGQVLIGGQACADRQAADFLIHPLRGPNALGHLRASVGGHEHLRPDGRLVGPRVEVVQPAVPLEAHRHHHAHHTTVRAGHELACTAPAGFARNGPVVLARAPRHP